MLWLKIKFVQWPDYVDPQNKFLRCHVSTFLTGQNKDKKSVTLDSLQAQNYQLLGLVVAEPFKSSSKSGLIDKTAQNVVKDSLICLRSVKTVELNFFVLYMTYATQASLLDSIREQTTPSPLALEVSEIPNLVPRSLVDEAKGEIWPQLSCWI